MITRALDRGELPLIWTIDRSEFIENIYRLQDGQLVLEPHNFEAHGWRPGQPEAVTPVLLDCFDRGGVVEGVFDGPKLVAVAVTDLEPVASIPDLVQLKFLHVDKMYRKRGVGAGLCRRALAAARQHGAGGLYISAAPSENTVNFYRRLGCNILAVPDPALFAYEPEDIHFEWR